MKNNRSISQESNLLWFFVFGLVVLFLPICLIVWKSLSYTHGVFVYPLDDTFIHLTIADNLLKGTWGVNENEFASASSSILYTVILSVCRFFSSSVLVPFVVNCLAGISLIISLHLWLKKHFVHYFGQALIFLLVVFFTPLPLIIVSGMEHTLQCLFSFLFIFHFSDWLEENSNSEKRILPLNIFLFAVLLSTIRYEGLFLIGIACVLLLIYKKIFSALALGAVSVMPLLIFGVISINKGYYFLPSSVMIKSGTFNFSNPVQVASMMFERVFYQQNGIAALSTQKLLIIVPLLYLIFKKYLRPSYLFILIFLFWASVLQLSLASTGWLYRYEAYLFFCFWIITPVVFYKHGKKVLELFNTWASRFMALALVFFLFFPAVLRSTIALKKTPQACINIYDQQYQMARFIKKYYDTNSTIALNDIGAVSYFTNAKIIDLWGLANIDVTKSKKHHYWNAGFLDSLCRANKVQVAIIYDSWFPDSLPKRWCKAATWKIQNNVICGDSIVSFYSIDTLNRIPLQQELKAFDRFLPSSVTVKHF